MPWVKKMLTAYQTYSDSGSLKIKTDSVFTQWELKLEKLGSKPIIFKPYAHKNISIHSSSKLNSWRSLTMQTDTFVTELETLMKILGP